MSQYKLKSHLIRVILLAVVCLCLSVYAWPVYCLNQSNASLVDGLLNRAEEWVEWGRFIPLFSDESLKSEIRIHRRFGRADAFSRAIKQGYEAELPAEFLELQQVLYKAQIGDLGPLEQRMPALLEEGTELPEVCEAFALGCLQQFRLIDARQILQQWKTDYPATPIPRYLLARIDEYQRSLETATGELTAAIRLCEPFAPAHYALGRIEFSQQNYETAIVHYQQAAAGLFEPQPALVALGRCYRELGNLLQARALLEQALLRPQERLEEAYRYVGEPVETSSALLSREMAMLSLAENRVSEAVKWFEKALNVDSKDWKTRFQYAQALRRNGQTELAEQQIRQAEESRLAFEEGDRLIDDVLKNPADVEARYRLGMILLRHLSENQGLVWLNSVLKYDPDHQPTHQALASYFMDHLNEHPAYPELARKHQELANRAQQQPQQGK